MAARKKATRKKKATRRKSAGSSDAMIISKSRVKAAVKKCNVGGEFYGALEAAVRNLIQGAEARALSNGRKTLRPQDV